MPRRTRFERERDLERISKRYLQGDTQYVISQDLKVTQQSVSNDIKELLKRWRASALVNVDDSKAKELARINHLEETYWEAWLESKEAEESTRVTASGSLRQPQGGSTQFVQEKDATTVRTQKKRDGDPRYLQGVQWCIERRCKILGIDAPDKLAPTTPDGKEPYGVVIYIPDNGRGDR